MTDVPTDSRAGCEELFGPVAVVEVVDDLDAAIAFANATPWGLGGAIHATDQKEIDAAIAGLDVGMVFANSIVASMPELPFGGVKESGFGRELGSSAFASSRTSSPSTWRDPVLLRPRGLGAAARRGRRRHGAVAARRRR